MAGQRIDIGQDEWNVTFVKGDSEYRVDSLVYTSLIMEKARPDEEPSKAIVVESMRKSLTSASDPELANLSDHEIWAMSVRLSKAMSKAGNG